MTDRLARQSDLTAWPDVATVPAARIRGAGVALLLRWLPTRLPLRVEYPDGTVRGRGRALLRLRRPADFCRRVGAQGLIGFGEAYQAGDWDSDDLAGLLSVLAEHADTLMPPRLQRLSKVFGAALPDHQDNSVPNSATNVSRHYDLSNELFAAFLDETMTYSAALFAGAEVDWDGLADAQRRKIDRLLDLTGVGEGSNVLEIGTGWGELAVRAARRGARVRTVTLSQEQRDHARDYVRRCGLENRVDVELRDYRHLDGDGEYDAICTVEMIEAVGERHWPEYFRILDRLLTPEGKIGMQAITMRHDHMVAGKDTYTWIHKYIFPGGLIPSGPAIREQISNHTGMTVVDSHTFGEDYAHTLQLWRERFASNVDEVARLGFDEIFRRTWDFYLAYSQAGFAAGYLNVEQLIAGRNR